MAIAVSVKVPILRTFYEKIYDRCSSWLQAAWSVWVFDVMHVLTGSPGAISHIAVCKTWLPQ